MWKLIALGLNTSGCIKCCCLMWLHSLLYGWWKLLQSTCWSHLQSIFCKVSKIFLVIRKAWPCTHQCQVSNLRPTTSSDFKRSFEYHCLCKYNTNTLDIARQVGKPKVGSNEWLEPMAMLTECTNEKYPHYRNPKITCMFHCNYRNQLHCNHGIKLRAIIEVTSLQFE